MVWVNFINPLRECSKSTMKDFHLPVIERLFSFFKNKLYSAKITFMFNIAKFCDSLSICLESFIYPD